MKALIKTTLISTAIAFAALGTVSAPAFAADEISFAGATAEAPNLAVSGYDVVSYQNAAAPSVGASRFAAQYDGATYYFSSQANLDAFNAAPATYVPAYGGFCAFGVSKGKKFDADPTAYTVVDGQLYLNLNHKILKKWRKKQDRYIEQADTNWPEIETVAQNAL